MDRRDLLRVGSATALTGLAGCTALLGGGSSGTETSTTARSTGRTTTISTTATTPTTEPDVEVTLELPADPRIADPVDLVVRVRNVGDEKGVFEDRLEVIGGEPSSVGITLGPIPPGETRTTTQEVGFDTPGRHLVVLADSDVRTRIPVGGTPLGASASLGEGVDFTLDSATVLPATFVQGPGWGYREDPVTDLVGADPDGEPTAVAVLRGTATATGSSPVEFGTTSLSVDAAGTQGTFLRGGTTLAGVDHTQLRLPDGTPNLVGTRLEPDESASGCLLCPLPRSAARETITVRAEDDGEATGIWSVATRNGRSLPQFAVEGFDVPDAMETARDYPFTVTVANVGGADGTFRGIVQDHIHHDTYTTVGTVTGEVPVGERKRLQGTIRLPWNYERNLRVRPSGTTATVEAGIARRNYGESYRMPNGVTVTLLSPRYSDTIEFVDDRHSFSHGFWTVLVTAKLPEEARGKGIGDELLPSAPDFRCKRMEVDEANFPYSQDYRQEFRDVEEYAREHGNTIFEPVKGPLYPMDPPAEPSEGHVSGWMPIIIGPDERHWPVEELEVQLVENVHEGYDGYTSGWSEKFGAED